MTQPRMPDGWTIRWMLRWGRKERREAEPVSAEKRFEAAARSVLLGGVCMAACAGVLLIWIASGVAESDIAGNAFAAGFALVGALLMALGAALRTRRRWARRIAVALCVLGVLLIEAFVVCLWFGAWGLLSQLIDIAPLWSMDRMRWFCDFAFVAGSCMVVLTVALLLAWKLWDSAAYLASRDAKRICGELLSEPRSRETTTEDSPPRHQGHQGQHEQQTEQG